LPRCRSLLLSPFLLDAILPLRSGSSIFSLDQEDPEARTAAVAGRRSAGGAADINKGDASNAP
jgi:hypothetical protein